MAALRVRENRACARELFTIAACSPPAGKGISCVYWTSPEAWANAARLMIGLRDREKFRILGALLRSVRQRSIVMIRRRHIVGGNLLGIDGERDVQHELVEEVFRQLTPVRPADSFFVHLVLVARALGHFLFQHGQCRAQGAVVDRLAGQELLGLPRSPDHRIQPAEYRRTLRPSPRSRVHRYEIGTPH